jgi:hypothetical protein
MAERAARLSQYYRECGALVIGCVFPISFWLNPWSGMYAGFAKLCVYHRVPDWLWAYSIPWCGVVASMWIANGARYTRWIGPCMLLTSLVISVAMHYQIAGAFNNTQPSIAEVTSGTLHSTSFRTDAVFGLIATSVGLGLAVRR